MDNDFAASRRGGNLNGMQPALPSHPRTIPDLRVLRRGPGEIQVGLDPRLAAVLTALPEPVTTALQRLSGRHDLAALVAELGEHGRTLRTAVTALASRGLLEDAARQPTPVPGRLAGDRAAAAMRAAADLNHHTIPGNTGSPATATASSTTGTTTHSPGTASATSADGSPTGSTGTTIHNPGTTGSTTTHSPNRTTDSSTGKSTGNSTGNSGEVTAGTSGITPRGTDTSADGTTHGLRSHDPGGARRVRPADRGTAARPADTGRAHDHPADTRRALGVRPVTDDDPAARRGLAVDVRGDGRLAVSVACLLATAGVGWVHVAAAGTVRPEDTGTGYLPDDVGRRRGTAAREAIARVDRGVRTTPFRVDRRPDLVVLADSLVHEPARAAALNKTGVPHLSARMRDGLGIVGPLVLPGRTSCLICADLHRSDLDERWPQVAVQLTGQVQLAGLACTQATAALAAAQALDALRWLGGTAPPPPTCDTTIELDLGAASVHRRPWRPHPSCSCGSQLRCSNVAANTNAELRQSRT